MRKERVVFLENRAECLEKIRGKDYIIYFLSEVRMGKNADPSILEQVEELLEAHFFDSREYLHLFPCDEIFYMVSFVDEPEKDDTIEERQLMRNREIREICCRKYIEYDRFGQAYVKMIRPVEFLNGGRDGRT